MQPTNTKPGPNYWPLPTTLPQFTDKQIKANEKEAAKQKLAQAKGALL